MWRLGGRQIVAPRTRGTPPNSTQRGQTSQRHGTIGRPWSTRASNCRTCSDVTGHDPAGRSTDISERCSPLVGDRTSQASSGPPGLPGLATKAQPARLIWSTVSAPIPPSGWPDRRARRWRRTSLQAPPRHSTVTAGTASVRSGPFQANSTPGEPLLCHPGMSNAGARGAGARRSNSFGQLRVLAPTMLPLGASVEGSSHGHRSGDSGSTKDAPVEEGGWVGGWPRRMNE